MILADCLAPYYLKMPKLKESELSFLDPTCQRFVVSNVASTYYSEKKLWSFADFPYPRPPFPVTWAEYKMPPAVYRSTSTGERVTPQPGVEVYFGASIKERPDGMITMSGAYFWLGSQGKDRGKMMHYDLALAMEFAIGEDGLMKDVLGARPEEPVSDHSLYTCFHPILMTFSLCNCKNIEQVTVKQAPQLNKARIKRGKPAIKDYRVINVLPVSSKARRERTVTASDPSQDFSVTIRRGHYACYGEKFGHWEEVDGKKTWVPAGKLFGKLEGRFYIPSIAVTGARRDYVVKAGKDD